MTEHSLSVDRRAVQTTSNAVLGMILFVISESMFVMAFFAVYASSYAAAPVWPPAGIPHPPIGLATASVVPLLASGITITMAARAGRRRDPRLARWVGASLVLAAAFTVLLAVSFYGLGFGIDDGIYGSLFYTVAALAFAHAVGGIVFFALVLLQAAAGELELRQDPVQAAAIYWYFVVAVGVTVYVVFYLANVGS